MAAMLTLYWSNYDTDIDSFSLLDYTDGLDLANRGWVPKVASGTETSLIEVLTMRIRADSDDDLATILQDLALWKKRVIWSTDGTDNRKVWLRAALDAETESRQALIVKMGYSFTSDLLSVPTRDQSIVPEIVITFERMPYWEELEKNLYTTTNIDKVSLNCIGGMVALDETIYGDVPGRVQWLRFYPDSTYSFSTFWAGFKTTRLWNTLAHFQPVWSLKDGSLGAYASTTTDTAAYSGTRVSCSPDATLREMVLIEVQDAIATYHNEMIGSYLVLLRARMEDTSIGRARISFGWSTGSALANPARLTRQIIQGTTYTLYEMGVVKLPPDPQSFSMQNCAISLDAELISGAGDLYLDCLVFIPVNEGMMKLEAETNVTGGTGLEIAMTHPNGKTSGFIVSGAYGLPERQTIGATDVVIYDWSIPANDEAPIIVCAGQAVAGSTKGDSFTLSYAHVQRWRSLRGAEG